MNSTATKIAAAQLLGAAKAALAAQMSARSRSSVALLEAIAQYERSLELDEGVGVDSTHQHPGPSALAAVDPRD